MTRSPATHANRLDSLRRAIGAARPAAAALPGPLGRVAALAGGGLHELVPAAHGDAAAVTGLALAVLAAGRPGALLWLTAPGWRREHGRVCARGLAGAGLDPGRVLFAAPSRPADLMWCAEEAVRSAAVAAVLAEGAEPGFTATRRLALACAATGVPLILCLPAGWAGATAAQTRWRVAGAPSLPGRHDPRAPGNPRWRLVLDRARPWPGAAGQGFDLEFDHATLSLRVADRLADRPAAPPGPGGLARTG